ncbi:MAG: hypothetical protein RI906_1317 [Pseudomonadota bacterium]|jgi:hypothetical protein
MNSSHLTSPTMPVFSCDAMVADASSYPPSAGKPALVIRDWQAAGLPIEVREPEPVAREQLALARDADFVNDILDDKRRNGFGNILASVAASLPYTTGAMLSAAREALRNGRVACAPVSGFHHAGYAHAGFKHVICESLGLTY